MEQFVIEIAGLVTRVQPMFFSTREYCRAYLSQLPAEHFTQVTREALVYEQAMLDREALEEGLKRREFTDPFLERNAIRRSIATKLLERDTLLLHGSTVAVDGLAYLFTAPCGTGKSTHTRFWREVFGNRCLMVNDDQAFLRLTDDGVLAYGSPWSGKHGLHTNICLPLRGICFLSRGSENKIRRAEPARRMEQLRHQCFVPETPEAQYVPGLLQALAQTIPLWEMECTKEPEAARVAYEAMCVEKT